MSLPDRAYPVHVGDDDHGEVWEYAPGRRLEGVHRNGTCRGGHCVMHNPSPHHMRGWPLVWRQADGLVDMQTGFERVCPHGVGHPDPDCISIHPVHGCDGCCNPIGADINRAVDIIEGQPYEPPYPGHNTDRRRRVRRS